MKNIYDFFRKKNIILLFSVVLIYPFIIASSCISGSDVTWGIGYTEMSMTYDVEGKSEITTNEKCINGTLTVSGKCFYGEIAIEAEKKETEEKETDYTKYLGKDVSCEKTEFGGGYRKNCTLAEFPLGNKKVENNIKTIDLSVLDIEKIIEKMVSEKYRENEYCSYENGNKNTIVCNVFGVKNFIYENSKLWESISIRVSKAISIKNELIINVSISGEYASNTFSKAPDSNSKAYKDMSKNSSYELEKFKNKFMSDISKTIENKKSKRDEKNA